MASAVTSGSTTAPHRVAVLGGGVMGSGIAQVLAVTGCDVVLGDLDAGALQRAEAQVRGGPFGLEAAVARGRLDEAGANAAAARITYVTGLEELGEPEIVIEAVPEDLALKIGVFRELDRLQPPSCILASNSSGLPVAALAAATDRPGLVVAWHWASPAPAMRLAEIVRTPATRHETIGAVRALAAAAGKQPVIVDDAPTHWGYVANRVYAAAYREAAQVVTEGVATEEDVDQLLVDCFRWPAGPFGMTRGAGTGWTR
jgi:3-hydroxybutyryl-CoA dehydrogenase/3-hydroxyacyl-CoA dehydrogenase